MVTEYTINTGTDTSVQLWKDIGASADNRVDALMSVMSLPEKVAQLFGVWVGVDSSDGEMAPHQHERSVACRQSSQHRRLHDCRGPLL